MLLVNLRCYSDFIQEMKPDTLRNGWAWYSVTDDETGNKLFVDRIEMDAALEGSDLVTFERFESRMKSAIAEIKRLDARGRIIFIPMRSD